MENITFSPSPASPETLIWQAKQGSTTHKGLIKRRDNMTQFHVEWISEEIPQPELDRLNYSIAEGALKYWISQAQESGMLNGIPVLGSDADYEDSEIELGLGYTSKKKAEDVITEILIEQIESGKELSWKQSWAAQTSELAQNFVTKAKYTGANHILLNVIYGPTAPSPYYLTFKQIKDLKGTLKKGARGYVVVFYNMKFKIKSEERSPGILAKVNGKVLPRKKTRDVNITEDNYTSILISEADVKRLELSNNEVLSIPILRYYKVFNVADTEGIEWTLPGPKKRSKTEIIELAENIVCSYADKPPIGPDPEHAVYDPKKDAIRMPDKGQFSGDEEYYSTLFHEMIHSTGHNKRLGRLDDYKGKDKDAAYAFEELVAELGASYLCGHSGIFHVVKENQAAYIKGWKEKLIAFAKKDHNFLLEAAKEAQKATSHILQYFDLETGECTAPGQKSKSKKEGGYDAKVKAAARIKIKLKLAKLKTK